MDCSGFRPAADLLKTTAPHQQKPRLARGFFVPTRSSLVG